MKLSILSTIFATVAAVQCPPNTGRLVASCAFCQRYQATAGRFSWKVRASCRYLEPCCTPLFHVLGQLPEETASGITQPFTAFFHSSLQPKFQVTFLPTNQHSTILTFTKQNFTRPQLKIYSDTRINSIKTTKCTNPAARTKFMQLSVYFFIYYCFV